MDIIGIAFFIVFGMIALSIGVTVYVLRALGLYRLAARAGLDAPWLAWIPIGDAYVMGALSIKSPYVMRKFPKMNIILPVIYAVSIVIPIVFQIVFMLSALAFAAPFFSGFAGEVLIVFIIFYVLTLLFSLFLSVVYTFVLYHIFKVYDPQNAVLYTILSVFGLSFIFLFIIRNREPSAKTEDI